MKKFIELLPIEDCCGVYLLFDPKGMKYVGASVRVRKRISNHRSKFKFKEAFLLEKVTYRSDLPKREKVWIERLKPELNQRFGGGGPGKIYSDAVKAKQSAWQLGVKKGPMKKKTAARIGDALRGRPKSEEHRIAAAAARKAVGNKPWTQERIDKFWTPERRKAASEKAKEQFRGKPWTKARRVSQ